MSSKQLAHLSLPPSLSPSSQARWQLIQHRAWPSTLHFLVLAAPSPMLASAEMYLLGQTERQTEMTIIIHPGFNIC